MYVSRQLKRAYWEMDVSQPVLELTLGGLLARVASEVPDRIALIDGSGELGARRRWTYRSLIATAQAVAHALACHFRLGERVAIWAPNCPEWILLQYGAAMAGLVLVPINPAFLADELRHVLKSSQAVGIFFAAKFRDNDLARILHRIRAELPCLRFEVSLEDWNEFLGCSACAATLPDVSPGDTVQIQYTSGTTGVPKGACLHHRGIVNAARFVAHRAGVGDGAVWINAMPLFHVGGSGVAAVGVLAERGTLVLMSGFDPARMLELLESERGTVTLLVPTMIVAVLEHADRLRRDLSSLRTLLAGGAPVSEALARRVTECLRCGFSILYGQTELNGAITQTTGDSTDDCSFTTVGQPLPQMELKIADPSTGEALPLNTTGEICARGYQTMGGYLPGASETSTPALPDDGWLHTGDLGMMDLNGHVRITGRLKEMIIRGGENIYPSEIENCLLAYPGIEQACVIGLPDEKWGEVVVAVLQLAADTSPGVMQDMAQEMQAYCRTRLAAFKAPVVWYFVEEWPQTASGKIARHRLHAQLLEGLHNGFVVPNAAKAVHER